MGYTGTADATNAVRVRELFHQLFDDRDLSGPYRYVYVDGAAFARQVGMLPAAGSVGDRLMTAGFNAVTRLRRRMKGHR